LLRSGAKDSLNVKGAYYEVIADAAGSVGVMVAGVLIILTGQPIWDVVVAALIAVFVIIRAVVLGRQVIAVLGQH
ncbi:cation transporter, partial [Micrococcus luteus]